MRPREVMGPDPGRAAHRIRCRLPLFFLTAVALGCSGAIGEGGGPADQGGAGLPGATAPDGTRPPAGSPPAGSPPAAPPVAVPPIGTGVPPGTPADPSAAGVLPLRRLTRTEYDNTIRDLLGDTSRPAAAFPEETLGPNGFPMAGTVSSVDVNRFAEAAAALAANAAKNLATLAPCATPAGSEACATDFIRKFGRRAFRRPLSADEVTELQALYRKGREAPLSLDHPGAMQLLLEAMLQAPQLLYRWELGPVKPSREGTVVRLNAHELASRLSYFLWSSMPDDELAAAADTGKLATAADVERHARRMLADARVRDTVETFHLEWLELGHIDAVQKDPKVYPGFDAKLKSAMEAEARAFLGETVTKDGRLGTLLTASHTFANEPLARIYGLPAVRGDELRRVELDPKQRFGFLTQAAFLATQAQTYEQSPVKRGKMIRERLLCQPIAPPPSDLEITPPPVDPKLQTRERYAAHSQVGICRGCHAIIDPLGFAFENYDGIGRWQTMEAGRPVDTSGVLTGLAGAEKPFANARELMDALLATDELRGCVARQWLRYALGRAESEADRASLQVALGAFAGANLDVRELLVALVKSRTFLYRAPGAGEMLP